MVEAMAASEGKEAAAITVERVVATAEVMAKAEMAVEMAIWRAVTIAVVKAM